MLENLKHKLSHHLLNIPGWKTNRRIVVIHSDDWGSIRMPSRKIFSILTQKNGFSVDNPYNRYDTLASADDLNALFNVLTSVTDKNGNPAVITANCLLANPDFQRIKESDYEKYFYENIDITFEKYGRTESLALWQQGLNTGIFFPQFQIVLFIFAI